MGDMFEQVMQAAMRDELEKIANVGAVLRGADKVRRGSLGLATAPLRAVREAALAPARAMNMARRGGTLAYKDAAGMVPGKGSKKKLMASLKRRVQKMSPAARKRLKKADHVADVAGDIGGAAASLATNRYGTRHLLNNQTSTLKRRLAERAIERSNMVMNFRG